jgi:hypothetical protein
MEEHFKGSQLVKGGECNLYRKKMLSQTIVVPVLHAWVSPVVDCIKLDIDDAFHEHTRQGGWCFVARNHQGVARGAGAGRIMYAGSTLQTEATAWGERDIHS